MHIADSYFFILDLITFNMTGINSYQYKHGESGRGRAGSADRTGRGNRAMKCNVIPGYFPAVPFKKYSIILKTLLFSPYTDPPL